MTRTWPPSRSGSACERRPPASAVTRAFERAAAENRAALIGYLPAGFPSVDGAIAAVLAMAQAGADIIEVGLPYSDPLMDGPVIQQATRAALTAGTRVADTLRTVEAIAADRRARARHDLLEPGRPLRRGRVRA